MSFSPHIVGHSEQLALLQSDVHTGNVAHAYLFEGAHHLGKMTIARQFASALLTHNIPEHERENAEREIGKLIHPDLLVLDQLWIEEDMEDWEEIAKSSNIPQVHRSKKPAAKTNIISIDDVRALQDRLYETATSPYRCCIIRSVERMQDAAANAFLKILEEPPPRLVFILTTESLSSLLPTIVSRTRVVRFRSLSPKELRPLVSGVDSEEAQFILHVARGAPGLVNILRNNPDSLRELRQAHAQAISFWQARSLADRLPLLTPLKERGEEAERLLLHLALALREQETLEMQKQSQAFHALVRGLQTNAHRMLLAEHFALSVEE